MIERKGLGIDNLFVIDTDDVASVKSKFYGYTITNRGMLDASNITADDLQLLDGNGCYISIDVSDDKITIAQDYNGCMGMYLFEADDYFALSNSFTLLVDHIKGKHCLSLNEDYANCFVIADLCSMSYSETLIKEIQPLPNNVYVIIDIQSKGIIVCEKDYKVDSVPLDSQEGFELLDAWRNRWKDVFRGIKSRTNNISCDLTGGYDSRMVLALLLSAGINVNDIKINSANDDLHCHAEDFKIASSIAKHFGFVLNNNSALNSDQLSISSEESLEWSFYVKLGLHKEMYFRKSILKYSRFAITGGNGEGLRGYPNILYNEYRDSYIDKCRVYRKDQHKMQDSVLRMWDNDGKILSKKYGIDSNNPLLATFLYDEVRVRNHYARAAFEAYGSNVYQLSPCMDAEIVKLQHTTSECSDLQLIMIIIFLRYCPELLQFPVEGGRGFNQETIEYAKRLNAKYPRNEQECNCDGREFRIPDHYFEPIELGSDQKRAGADNDKINRMLSNLFLSQKVRNNFCEYFDESTYDTIAEYIKNHSYHPYKHAYSVIAIAKAIEDVKISHRNEYNASLNDFLQSSMLDDRIEANNISVIKDFVTARLDIIFEGDSNADFSIVNISDTSASQQRPAWLQNDEQQGFVIESDAMQIDIQVRSSVKGTLRLKLKGRDVRQDGKRIPAWIDYTKFVYCGALIFDERIPTWHDQPKNISYEILENQLISFHIEWTIHRDERRILVADEKYVTESRDELSDILYDIKNSNERIEKMVSERGECLKRLNPKNWIFKAKKKNS